MAKSESIVFGTARSMRRDARVLSRACMDGDVGDARGYYCSSGSSGGRRVCKMG
jgi:hypothetical protein